MTRLVHRTPNAAVYDDVLPEDQFRRLFVHLNGLEYQSVHHHGWRKVWRLHDGTPLTSRACWYCSSASAKPPEQDLRYPTGTPLDPLLEWILDRLPEVEDLTGLPEKEWKRMSFAPWIYPPGSGLSLHRDGVLYSGAFTFFAHPEWRLHWGGQLLLLDYLSPRAKPLPEGGGGPWPPFLSDEAEHAGTFDPGVGTFVLAKPNRLVFLSPHTQHLMTRVDSNAGQNSRVSVAGFFHRE